MKKIYELKFLRFLILSAVSVFCFLSPAFGADAQRAPIDINLIIDGTASFSGVREEIASWISGQLDQILSDGDRVTVWNTGTEAKIVYSGTVNTSADRETVKKTIRELSVSGNYADFSGALREVANRRSSGLSYTLLISASNEALNSFLSSPQADLLRYSRVEEFSSWRAVVVGLNLDTRVRRAASVFLGS